MGVAAEVGTKQAEAGISAELGNKMMCTAKNVVLQALCTKISCDIFTNSPPVPWLHGCRK